jgi:hypothetical protein
MPWPSNTRAWSPGGEQVVAVERDHPHNPICTGAAARAGARAAAAAQFGLGRAVVAGDDERLCLVQHAAQLDQVVIADAPFAAQGHQALHAAQADAGDTRQQRRFCAVHVQREHLAVGQRPGQLGVDVQRQVAALAQQLTGLVAVATQQEVGLVQAVLAQQRRAARGTLPGLSGIGLNAE